MTKKVYILELVGDIESTSGTHTIEVGGVSLSRQTLEDLKCHHDRELDEYFGDDEEEDTFTYLNTDYSSRPEWVITEHDLV